jgi:hypothetical protein
MHIFNEINQKVKGDRKHEKGGLICIQMSALHSLLISQAAAAKTTTTIKNSFMFSFHSILIIIIIIAKGETERVAACTYAHTCDFI